MRVIRKYEINRELESKYALENYIGKTFSSKNYDDFIVLGVYDKYVDKSNRKLRYVIEFLNTGFQTVSFPNRIRSGDVKDYMNKCICDVGYIGEWELKGDPSKHFLYSNWSSMLQRCYNKNCNEYRKDGEIHKDWHCFVDFIKDSENILGYKEMIENPDVKFCIDKDFIEEGNQLYSKKNCIFIPSKINSFIATTQKNRQYKYEGIYVKNSLNVPFNADAKINRKTLKVYSGKNPIHAHEYFWEKKLEIAHLYIKQDYPFMSNELRQVIYDRVKLREQLSLKELNRAIEDGYFKDIM